MRARTTPAIAGTRGASQKRWSARSAITRTVNDFARKNNLLKDADSNFSGDDTREGLTAIISVKIPDPQFESQTKVKLMNPEVQTAAQQVVSEAHGYAIHPALLAAPATAELILFDDPSGLSGEAEFELADGGTLFLDEIGDVPLSIQVKLLRVLETKQFEHVGDDRPISVDVRIITATNKNLEELIAQKRFRDDLYFRINVFPIHLPPLRDRSEDIPLLVNTFIRRMRSRTGKNISRLTPAAMERFMQYHWPGNIRELKSALEFAFVIAEGEVIDIDQLPPKIAEPQRQFFSPGHRPSQGIDHNKTMETTILSSNPSEPAEKRMLIEALKKTNGNQSQAARILEINRVTVWHRMKKYGIDLKKILSV